MSFRLAIVSKVELWNFRNFSSLYDVVDDLRENPFADAITLLVEFFAFLFCSSCLEFVMRNFLATVCDNHLSLFISKVLI